jgi:NADH-quinone oxidoreductase subunit E
MSTEATSPGGGVSMMLNPELIGDIKELMTVYPKPKSAILMALHRIQEELGWVPPEAQAEVAEIFDMPPADVQSLVTFYYMFHRKPVGNYVIKVCRSISCWLRGSDGLISHLEENLKCKLGESSPDGKFTLVGGECLAGCTGAPCFQVNDRFFENADFPKVDALIERLRSQEGDPAFPPAVDSVPSIPIVPEHNAAGQGVTNAKSI